ncbi:dephospho-CoA kinase [Paenibacillus sp. SC116]|uniref:dephospho-CoA kinase n=1 Tax=Paenibacillus sp. SC116 TaxID=2968986 RepID=UPI00215B5FE8|nr:dephospho-CoA kinase [Paenibacillus sp. SC116]MCR8843105.1 dephospho-CoA kinase [Paenibacillus sp. SC116]
MSLAITGGLRSGKDVVGKYLSENYGCTRFAFGDELKADFHRRYPEIPRDPKPRVGYQAHGQLVRKLLGEDVWVDICFKNIKHERSHRFLSFRPVITDLRQPNEYARCRAEGYVIIRVTAPEGVRINRAVESADKFDYKDLAHETELYVNTFEVDYEIINDGTIEELHAKIDAIMEAIGIE